jgi:metal-responsive CopG/Arc/MetJ family transcriptional regulator
MSREPANRNHTHGKQPYGKQLRSFTFTLTDDLFVRFTLKLRHESVSRNEFFRELVHAFIEDEENLQKFIRKYKLGEFVTRHSQTKQNIIDKEIEHGEKNMEQFGLSETEVEDLYDIIEEEIDL